MCETLLDDSAVSVNAIFNHVNVMFLLMPFSRMVSTVLALSGFKDKIILLQGSEMSAELHSRNLVLGIKCFTISVFTEKQ